MNEALAPGREPRAGWPRRIALFPITRILIFIAGVVAAVAAAGLVAGWLAQGLGTWWPRRPGNVALQIVAVHFAYRGIVRLLERRTPDELSLDGAARETGAGALVGGGCLTVTVAIIAALGYYQVEGTGAWATALATAVAIAAGAGYIEEVIFRGVVFRIAEEALGTWLALGITVALFGLAHLGNPNATLYGAAAIGIEAGMLLGAAYVLTRRLWFAIGLHFAWNFLQAGVFGPSVSGVGVQSVLRSELTGPELLSGGALGVEGSVFAIAVCLLTSMVLLSRARRDDRFIRPFWRRRAP